MTDRATKLNDIAERAEKATADEQRELLFEAAKLVWRWGFIPDGTDTDPWVSRWNRFHRQLDARAWESAALMLMPDGAKWKIGNTLTTDGDWYAEIEGHETSCFSRHAATPALALVAAICRALAEEN